MVKNLDNIVQAVEGKSCNYVYYFKQVLGELELFVLVQY